MSDIQGGTIRERLARLETLMCNHIAHHEKRDKWMMLVITGSVVGVILIALPGCVRLLGSIL